MPFISRLLKKNEKNQRGPALVGKIGAPVILRDFETGEHLINPYMLLSYHACLCFQDGRGIFSKNSKIVFGVKVNLTSFEPCAPLIGKDLIHETGYQAQTFDVIKHLCNLPEGKPVADIAALVNSETIGVIRQDFVMCHLPETFRYLNGMSQLLSGPHIPDDGERRVKENFKKSFRHISEGNAIFLPTIHLEDSDFSHYSRPAEISYR
jgi:hypothetical protein